MSSCGYRRRRAAKHWVFFELLWFSQQALSGGKLLAKAGRAALPTPVGLQHYVRAAARVAGGREGHLHQHSRKGCMAGARAEGTQL